MGFFALPDFFTDDGVKPYLVFLGRVHVGEAHFLCAVGINARDEYKTFVFWSRLSPRR